MPAPVNCYDLENAVIAALKPGGVNAIQYCNNCKAGKGSFFLEENVLLFVLEGSSTFRYGNVTYNVKKQQVIFFSRDIVIECRSEEEASIFLFFVLKNELIIDFAKLARLTTTYKEMPGMVMVKDSSARIQRFIASLQTYFLEEECITDSLAQLKLMELLFCLSRNEQSILEQVLNVRERLRPNISHVVEENIMNSMTLYQLARLAGRSVSSFRRDFLSTYNMPPSRWIRLKRLEKAQELLRSTNMSISSVCYTLGFESVAHFSRIFKSQFGHPPSEFRLNLLVA